MGSKRVLGLRATRRHGRCRIYRTMHWCVRAFKGGRSGRGFSGGEEEGAHGRQTESNAMIAVAMEKTATGSAEFGCEALQDA